MSMLGKHDEARELLARAISDAEAGRLRDAVCGKLPLSRARCFRERLR